MASQPTSISIVYQYVIFWPKTLGLHTIHVITVVFYVFWKSKKKHNIYVFLLCFTNYFVACWTGVAKPTKSGLQLHPVSYLDLPLGVIGMVVFWISVQLGWVSHAVHMDDIHFPNIALSNVSFNMALSLQKWYENMLNSSVEACENELSFSVVYST